MRCPFCNDEESKVTDSRNATETNAVRRRRECLKCLRRFTTFETIDLTIQVQKRDGRYEDFRQDKGLDAACSHTRISHDQARALSYKIASDLMERQVREVKTSELGEIVMGHLQALDTIAYIRFACVYRRFKDVGELIDAIQYIKSKDEKYEKEELITQG